jgi:hypothetical protein
MLFLVSWILAKNLLSLRKSLVSKGFFEMSIMEYNGGSVLAMKGKDCVVLASDKR